MRKNKLVSRLVQLDIGIIRNLIIYSILTFYFLLFTFHVQAQSPSFSFVPLGPTRNPSNPTFVIASPLEGQTILGSNVTVSFQAGNFEFKDFTTNTIRRAGEGHIHFWLDEEHPTKNNAKEHTSLLEYTFFNVEPGDHVLKTELVRNDHSSFNPRVLKEVRFVVQAPEPVSTQTMSLNESSGPTIFPLQTKLQSGVVWLVAGAVGLIILILLGYIITLL